MPGQRSHDGTLWMKKSRPSIPGPDELSKIYRTRFSGLDSYRRAVWKHIITQLLSPWIPSGGQILDLGAGHGEFINQVTSRGRLWGMDMNPDTGKFLEPRVTFLRQDCSRPWKISSRSLDLVFTSNFFEHLPDKECLQRTLQQAFRALRPGGHLVALGPNIRLVPGAYWDFWDHYLPLTERSLAEAGKLAGFTVERSLAATLPYSMSQGFQPPLWAVRVYLAMPILWRFFGKQFLVVLRKPS
jgi:SAM-dependent methyltransferase